MVSLGDSRQQTSSSALSPNWHFVWHKCLFSDRINFFVVEVEVDCQFCYHYFLLFILVREVSCCLLVCFKFLGSIFKSVGSTAQLRRSGPAHR